MPLISLLDRNYISCTRIQTHKECEILVNPTIPQNQLLQGEQFAFSFAFAFSTVTRHIQIDTIRYVATGNKFKDRFSSIAYVLVTLMIVFNDVYLSKHSTIVERT